MIILNSHMASIGLIGWIIVFAAFYFITDHFNKKNKKNDNNENE